MESIKSDQISYQTKQLKSKLEASKSAIHFKYESSDWNWQSYNLSSEMPNPDFVFHNKLPKSGEIFERILQMDQNMFYEKTFAFVTLECGSQESNRFNFWNLHSRISLGSNFHQIGKSLRNPLMNYYFKVAQHWCIFWISSLRSMILH